MKKIIILAISIVSLLLVFYQFRSAIQHYSLGQDIQISTLVQKVEYPSEMRLIQEEKSLVSTLNFIAKYDNLGTIALLFNNNNFGQIENNTFEFRIKEKDSSQWQYKQLYNSNQLNPHEHYVFGFPTFKTSKDEEFIFQIEQLDASSNNRVSLNVEDSSYFAKYSYPRKYLIDNPQQVITLIKGKMTGYLAYIPKLDLARIIFFSFIPYFAYTIAIIGIRKHNKYRSDQVSYAKLTTMYGVITPVAIFFTTFVVSGYFSSIGVDPHHDGILLKPAFDLLTAKVLFKDSFLQYGALTTMIQSLALSIFGSYLIVIKLLTSFFYALISLLLYFIYKRYLPTALLLASILVWVLMAPYYLWIFLPWSSVYALFFQLLSVYLFIIFFEKKSYTHFYLASFSASLIFWCRQPVGLFTLTSIVAYFVYLYAIKVINRSTLAKYTFNFMIVNIITALLFLLYFVFNNSLTDWYRQSILLLYSFAQEYGSSFNIMRIINDLFPRSLSPLSTWTLIPISSLLLLFLNHTKNNKALTFIIFVSISSWMQYYPVSEIRHQYWAATPMIPLFFLFIYEIVKAVLSISVHSKKNIQQAVTIIVALIIFMPDISHRLIKGFIKLNTYYEQVEKPEILRGMNLSSKEARFFKSISQEMISYLDSNPGKNIIMIGPDALYLTFDSRIINIHPMYVSWEMVNRTIYPEYEDVVTDYYKREKPMIILKKSPLPEGYCQTDYSQVYDKTILAMPCADIVE